MRLLSSPFHTTFILRFENFSIIFDSLEFISSDTFFSYHDIFQVLFRIHLHNSKPTRAGTWKMTTLVTCKLTTTIIHRHSSSNL